MKILFVHRYFWPDISPCSLIVYEISKFLAKKHSVEVLSSQPSYRYKKKFKKLPSVEILQKVFIRRLNLPTETTGFFWRIFNAFHLGVWIFLKCITKKYDIIIATTIPPILGGFFSALLAKLTNTRFVYYCMDLHPETGRVSGDFKNPILYNLLLKLDNWSCKLANPVLVHSRDMKNTLLARPSGKKYKIGIINNFAPASSLSNKNTRVGSYDKKKNLKIIYAGNIGRFQGLETVIDAMNYIKLRKDIKLTVVGDGSLRSKLIQKSKKNRLNIRFIERQSLSVTKNLIKKSDIGLVSLIPEMYKYSYPSKIMTYLEQGKPFISLFEKKSEITKKMQLQNYGFLGEVNNYQNVGELFIKLADNVNWKNIMRHKALYAFKKNFSANVILKKWSKVIENKNISLS